MLRCDASAGAARYLLITPVAAGGPLLDGSPVTLLVGRDGSAELETDMLVLGCAAGSNPKPDLRVRTLTLL